MKVIWKYPLNPTDSQEISVPENAEFLTVQMQQGTPCLWALVDPESSLVSKTVRTLCTGNAVDEIEGDYIATYQVYGGDLVFHVFVK